MNTPRSPGRRTLADHAESLEHSLYQTHDEDDEDDDDDNFQASRPEAVVQLLHQTVREFLTRSDKSAAPFGVSESEAKLKMLWVLAQYVPLALAVLEDDLDPDRISRKSGMPYPREVKSWTADHYRDLVRHIEDRPLLHYSLGRLARRFKDLDFTVNEAHDVIHDYLRRIEGNPQGFAWCLLDTWALEIKSQPITERSAYHDEFKITCLVAAVQERACNAVRSLVELRVNIDGVDKYSNNTALQTAALAGDKHMLRILIDCGANVNFCGGHFDTALQCAAYQGSEEAIQFLFNQGADVNREGGFYKNAFMAAACMGRVTVTQALHDSGANLPLHEYIQDFLESVERDQLERVTCALISVLTTIWGPLEEVPLGAMGIVAELFLRRGIYPESEELFSRLFEEFKKRLEAGTAEFAHEACVTYYTASLAIVLGKQGKYQEREQRLFSMLEILSNDRSVYDYFSAWAVCKCQLAIILRAQRKSMEAQAMAIEALNALEEFVAEDEDSWVLSSLLERRGTLEGFEFFGEAVEILRRYLSPNDRYL